MPKNKLHPKYFSSPSLQAEQAVLLHVSATPPLGSFGTHVTPSPNLIRTQSRSVPTHHERLTPDISMDCTSFLSRENGRDSMDYPRFSGCGLTENIKSRGEVGRKSRMARMSNRPPPLLSSCLSCLFIVLASTRQGRDRRLVREMNVQRMPGARDGPSVLQNQNAAPNHGMPLIHPPGKA